MILGLKKRPSLIVLGVLSLQLLPALDAVAQDRVEVIVRLDGSQGQVRQLIESLGGEVTHEYTYLGSLLAEVPMGSLKQIQSGDGVKSVHRNTPIQAP